MWELVGIDLTGPLPRTSEGFLYILTATDYYSKWVEAYALKSKTAAEVAEHICAIIYRHGCPRRILSDQGREFVNEASEHVNYLIFEIVFRICPHVLVLRVLISLKFVFQLNHKLCAILGIERSVTAAYHPQTNGLDEKTNDNIKRQVVYCIYILDPDLGLICRY